MLSQTLMSKYRTSWECAELLIELGGGGSGGGGGGGKSNDIPSAPLTSTSTPLLQHLSGASGKRDRATTLIGDGLRLTTSRVASFDFPTVPNYRPPNPDSSPSFDTAANGPKPTSMSRNGQDLSHRQLLLREMLNKGNATANSAAEESHLC